LGIERLLELIVMPEVVAEGYYLGAMDEESLPLILQATQKIRAFHKAIVEYEPKSLKAHLKGADRIGARYCAIIGENERDKGTIWIKDLVEQREFTLPLNQLT
jgi:histidyl-tRNA synthetase